MRSLLILAFTFSCGWCGVVEAQSMTQREAFEKMAEIYEAAGMHDLADQSRELGKNLDSVQPMAPTYTAPTVQRGNVSDAYRQMEAQRAERQRQWEAKHCFRNGCTAK